MATAFSYLRVSVKTVVDALQKHLQFVKRLLVQNLSQSKWPKHLQFWKVWAIILMPVNRAPCREGPFTANGMEFATAIFSIPQRPQGGKKNEQL